MAQPGDSTLPASITAAAPLPPQSSSSSSAAAASSVLAKRLAKVNKDKADKAAAAAAAAALAPPPPTVQSQPAVAPAAIVPALAAGQPTDTAPATTFAAFDDVAVAEHPVSGLATASFSPVSSAPTGGMDQVMWCLYVEADGSLCWSSGDPSTILPASSAGFDNAKMSPVVVRSLPGAIPTVAQQPLLAASPHLTGSNKGQGQGQGQDDAADGDEGGEKGLGAGNPPAGHSWVHVALVLDSSPDDDDIDDNDDGDMAAAAENQELDLAGGAEATSLPLRVTLYVDHKQVYPHPQSQSRLHETDSTHLLQLRKLPRCVLVLLFICLFIYLLFVCRFLSYYLLFFDCLSVDYYWCHEGRRWSKPHCM